MIVYRLNYISKSETEKKAVPRLRFEHIVVSHEEYRELMMNGTRHRIYVVSFKFQRIKDFGNRLKLL